MRRSSSSMSVADVLIGASWYGFNALSRGVMVEPRCCRRRITKLLRQTAGRARREQRVRSCNYWQTSRLRSRLTTRRRRRFSEASLCNSLLGAFPGTKSVLGDEDPANSQFGFYPAKRSAELRVEDAR
jgi:hypothetical protein